MRWTSALLAAGTAFAAIAATMTNPALAQCAGTTCVVNTGGDGAGTLANPTLRFAIGHANANTGTTITFNASLANSTITLASELPLILGNTTISGGSNNITVSGGSTSATTGFRVFFIGGAGQLNSTFPATTATIDNLTITNANARGGTGSGGGGAGLGGAVFVSSTGTLTLSNVSLANNAANGGAGAANAGGGSGMGGNGGSTTGGGGGFGSAAAGGDGAVAGSAGAFTGGAAGGNAQAGAAGGSNGGGGGGAGGVGVTSAGGGGVGGGAGTNPGQALGGNGGFGGGGGSGCLGGDGGFGGGGAGAHCANGSSDGGFGGGGAGGGVIGVGNGGFGGGNAGTTNNSHGGGGGMGGAIFVTQGGSLTLGGTLTVKDSAVTGGAGGGDAGAGSAFGAGMFLQGNGTISFQPGVGQTQTISDAIDDQTGRGGSGNFASGGPTCTPGAATPCAGYAGAGSWSLTKNGAGTLVLSGTNAYSGGTNITGGVLQFNLAAAIGGTGANVTVGTGGAAAAGYAMDQAFLARIAAGSAGVVALAADSANNLNFNTAGLANASLGAVGIATYTGTLTPAGTTYRLGGGGGTLTVTSALTGANSLVVGTNGTPPGTLILTNANTYSGGTTINAGTLQVGNGGTSGSIAGNVANNATLAFNRSDASTFGGAISGTGAVQQLGTGTLTLAGANTYTGATTVSAGTLAVNGSIAPSSGLDVNSGATVGGTGTLPTTRVNAGGTLAPGNSIGTINVSGNLVFATAATYMVEVSPTDADRTNVTGAATLAGTVQATFASGAYLTKTYTIVSATGGRSGTFGTLTASNLPAGFAASLSYTGTDALLNLTAVLGQQQIGLGGLGGNQANVANALNTFFNNGGTLPPNFLTVFGLTGNNLAAALSLLSGEAGTAAQQGAFQLLSQFLGLLLDPFADGRGGDGGPALPFAPDAQAKLPPEIAAAYAAVLKAPAMKPPVFEARWSGWAAGYGGYNRTNGDPAVVGSQNVTARTGGYAGGLDYRITRDTVVGFALAGGSTNWGLTQGLGGGRSEAAQAGIYAATRNGPAYLSAALAYSWHRMSTDRLAFAADHLTAAFNAQGFGARIESGYRVAMQNFGVTPYAAVQVQNFRTPSYAETDLSGGGFGLAYAARSATDTRSEFGSRYDQRVMLDNGAVLTLRGRAAWAHDWVRDPSLAATFQALPGASFIVNGAAPAKNSLISSSAVELRLRNNWSLGVKFDGEYSNGSRTYAGTGTVRYAW